MLCKSKETFLTKDRYSEKFKIKKFKTLRKYKQIDLIAKQFFIRADIRDGNTFSQKENNFYILSEYH